jgi:hypothetical protein
MWMRHFAVQRSVGNFDSYGWDRGKNDYLYSTAAGFVHMPWDIDYSLGLGRPANEPLFASNDPRIAAMFNTPAIVRAYWRAFLELVNGPFSNAALDPHIDARVHALTNNDVNIDQGAVATIKTYIADRRSYLQSQLSTVDAPFGVLGPVSYSTNNNLLLIVGSAPVNVKNVILNGTVYPVTWTNVTNFVIRVVLNGGLNNFVIQGLDRLGNPVVGASNMLTVNYTGPVVNPVGALILNEVMYATVSPNRQFVEILNRAAFNFDLSGWRIDGLNFTFPAGSIVTNRQIIVVARNRDVYYQTYGRLPFAVCNANLSALGQRLLLIKPGVPETLIDGLAYEPGAPWPVVTNGVSIQLIDVAQDNSRAANWAADFTAFATPGASNSVVATLPAFAPLWLNEIQFEDFNGPLDNFGVQEPWLELFNAGGSSVSLNGYYLATNFTSNLLQWPFPAITIAPGEHRIVWVDGGGVAETDAANVHTDFRLDYQGKLALVRTVASQPQIVDHFAWKLPNPNLSYGSYPDGQSLFRYTLQDPTPGETNQHRAVAVMINEWLTANTVGLQDPADGLRDDWIELYNGENSTVDLGGYYLTDDLFAPTKFQIPSNGQYRITPGSNLLVWTDNTPNQNSPARADLHVNFRLGSDFGYIGLYAPDGTNLIDSVVYGQQYPDVSEGRYPDGSRLRFAMPKTTPKLPNVHSNYNSRPSFPPLGPFFASPGTTVTYTIAASDPDRAQPNPQTLTYSILSAPFDSRLNQGGLYRWIIPTNQPLGEYPITLRVTDSGTPPRSDDSTFTVTLRPPAQVVVIGTNPPPVLYGASGPGGQFTFTIGTSVGHTYRISYKTDLDGPTWTQLDRDFVAANPYASITDVMTEPRRFYRVEQLD